MIEIGRLELKARSLLRKRFPRSAAPGIGCDPYDVEALRQNATRALDKMRRTAFVDPAEKCRCILEAMQTCYPTKELADEYLSTLEQALHGKDKLDVAGQVVIGVGPGRCGSTSLSQMLGTIPDSCCTHEGPPPIFWEPTVEQVDFHVRRFALLAQYHSVVSDVSHWWLNAVDQVWDRLAQIHVIGLVRDPEDCAESFMRIQGFGKGSWNPWAPRGHDFWLAGSWAATYPSYPVPDLSKHDPDQVKLEQIARYVREYNEQMKELAASRPDRVKLMPTAALSSPEVQAEIFAMTKHLGESATWRLNVKGVRDGKKNQIKI